MTYQSVIILRSKLYTNTRLKIIEIKSCHSSIQKSDTIALVSAVQSHIRMHMCTHTMLLLLLKMHFAALLFSSRSVFKVSR
jgi:hypothetical protein